jgi:hypothetical protein
LASCGPAETCGENSIRGRAVLARSNVEIFMGFYSSLDNRNLDNAKLAGWFPS